MLSLLHLQQRPQALGLVRMLDKDEQVEAARVKGVHQQADVVRRERAADQERTPGRLHHAKIRQHLRKGRTDRIVIDLKTAELLDLEERVQEKHRSRVQVDEGIRIMASQGAVQGLEMLAVEGRRVEAGCILLNPDDRPGRPELIHAIEVAAVAAVLYKWLGSGTSPPPPLSPPAVPVQQAGLVFDRAGFMNRVMEDTALARMVIAEFQKDFPVQIETLRRACSEGAAPDIAKCAHKLKGAAGVVGGGALRDLAAEMEVKAGAGDVQWVCAQLPELDSRAQALVNALRREVE